VEAAVAAWPRHQQQRQASLQVVLDEHRFRWHCLAAVSGTEHTHGACRLLAAVSGLRPSCDGQSLYLPPTGKAAARLKTGAIRSAAVPASVVQRCVVRPAAGSLPAATLHRLLAESRGTLRPAIRSRAPLRCGSQRVCSG